MLQNEVIRKGDIVIKNYASHLNYLKEAGIYEKLKGTGLAPELRFSGNDTIEHVFVEGESLQKMLDESASEPSGLAGCFELFFGWYSKFRALTGNCLDHISFGKFIAAKDGLKCIDFEHCRPDYLEHDIAKLCADLCLKSSPFSFRTLEICRLFFCVGAAHMSWNPERLAICLEDELKKRCRETGAEYRETPARYLITSVCSCGILFAEDPLADTEAAMPFISTSPQRIIVCSEEGRPECPSFDCFPTGSSPVTGLFTASRLMRSVSQPWSLWLNASEKYTRESIVGLLSCDKEGFDAVIASSEGSGRIFPMLIRTQTAQVALNSAVSSGIPDLKTAIKKLKVKYL